MTSFRYPAKEIVFSCLINIFTCGFYWLFFTFIHKSQVEDFCDKSKICYSSLDNFIREFNSVNDWELRRDYRSGRKYKSLFSTNCDSRIHANIIEINGKGLIMSSFGFLVASFIANKKIKELKYPANIKKIKYQKCW